MSTIFWCSVSSCGDSKRVCQSPTSASQRRVHAPRESGPPPACSQAERVKKARRQWRVYLRAGRKAHGHKPFRRSRRRRPQECEAQVSRSPRARLNRETHLGMQHDLDLGEVVFHALPDDVVLDSAHEGCAELVLAPVGQDGQASKLQRAPGSAINVRKGTAESSNGPWTERGGSGRSRSLRPLGCERAGSGRSPCRPWSRQEERRAESAVTLREMVADNVHTHSSISSSARRSTDEGERQREAAPRSCDGQRKTSAKAHGQTESSSQGREKRGPTSLVALLVGEDCRGEREREVVVRSV